MQRKRKPQLGIRLIVTLTVVLLMPRAHAQSPLGEPIPIGLSAPLTTQFAQNGKWMREGAELAIKEINDAGGIKGRPLKLFIEDDQGTNPTGAVNAVTKLIPEPID